MGASNINSNRKAILRRRMKRWSIEIGIACLLTLAALAYLGVTLLRSSDLIGGHVSDATTGAPSVHKNLSTKQ